MTAESTKRVLSVEEARLQLGISRGLMYEAVRRGEIPSIRIGRRIIIPAAAFEQFLQGKMGMGKMGMDTTVMADKNEKKT